MIAFTTTVLAALALAAAPAAFAQHDHGAGEHVGSGAGQHAPGPYAGMQHRAVKSLSNQQLADLRAGKGMSLALPAELNGYPGPAHTLELADSLALTDEQQARTRALFEQMQQEAQAAGGEVIRAETALDRLFKDRKATPQALAAATATAAHAHGRLREAHLRYHLVMVEVLSPEQVAAYNRMRGY
jgi:Spy/CpxP family protein refolding chaperone